jgi:hypothetical protein
MFGLIGLALGWLGRWSLHRFVQEKAKVLMRQIAIRWVAGGALLAALFLLSDFFRVWRPHPYPYGLDIGQDIVFVAIFFGLFTGIAFLVALVSQYGLRKALEIDAAILGAAFD